MCWLYMYLSDVDQVSGPHQVIRRSSDPAMIGNCLSSLHGEIKVNDFFYQYGYQIPREVIDSIFSAYETTILGPAGTTFFSNGFNFHRIRYPLQKRRLIFAARFAINPSVYGGPNRDGDPIPGDIIAKRVEDNPELRHITRKLADWRTRAA